MVCGLVLSFLLFIHLVFLAKYRILNLFVSWILIFVSLCLSVFDPVEN